MEKLPLKAFGRSLSDFEPLKPAEKILLDACRKGEIAVISEMRPEQDNKNNIVRADFVRFLALDGDEYTPVHEKGVWLSGAWVIDDLNFDGVILPHSLVLKNCRLNSTSLFDSNINDFLSFEGCDVKGLNAERMACSGSVFLRLNFTTTGTVNLKDAKIDGNLECQGGKFNVDNINALVCDSAVIKGAIFLSNGFTAKGTVRLLDTQIGGSLECTGGTFNDTHADNKYVGALICDRAVIKGSVFLNNNFTANGTVCLSGVQIGGDLDCNRATLDGTKIDGTNVYALVAQNMTVTGIFFFSNLLRINGFVSLCSTKVNSLSDDLKSWSKEELILDGFVYDILAGTAPTDAKRRITWLKDKQLPSHAGQEGNGKEFRPQPWQQLQKVLYDMGHFEDLRLVAIAYQNQRRKANLIGQSPESRNKIRAWIYKTISCGLHWLYGLLFCYGYYKPSRLLIEILIVWFLCGAFYTYAAYQGIFAPSNPLIFQNPEYNVCKADKDESKFELHEFDCTPPTTQGAGNWYLCANLREEYTGFSPFTYSLDLILPVVDLQQEHDWSPMIPTPKDNWICELSEFSLKHWTRLVMWIEILCGWIASLLLVAVVSGLTKRREE